MRGDKRIFKEWDKYKNLVPYIYKYQLKLEKVLN